MAEEGEILTFDDVYQINNTLKRGPYSAIYKCINKQTGQKCAVKIIDLAKFTKNNCSSAYEAFKLETEKYYHLSNKHIIQLIETYSSNGLVFLVFEFIEGNDLLSEILQRANSGFVYSENVISYYMKQILEAVSTCHKADVIHGNIKPENVILFHKDNLATLKLCGFSFSLHQENNNNHVNEQSEPDDQSYQMPLTSSYCAPEIRNDKIRTKASDIYSCGVILFTLLSGSTINIHDESQMFILEDKVWSSISDSAKDLVLKMLHVNPLERITADEALNDKWIKHKDMFACKLHLMNTIEEMRQFSTLRKLKREISSITFNEKLEQFDDDSVPQKFLGDIKSSLDKVMDLSSIKTNEELMINHFVQDEKLNNLLQIYDFIRRSSRSIKMEIKSFESSPLESYNQVTSLLNGPFNQLAESFLSVIHDLLIILMSPHFEVLFKITDIITKEIYEPRLDCDNCDNLNYQYDFNNLNEQDMSVTNVRIVQFYKNSNEPMGITLKLDEKGRCIVSRIMHGGMIHRQATLHVGDEICEINGISVLNQSVENLQRMLRDTNGNVNFKIIPNYIVPPAVCQIFVRAQFKYDPKDDEHIPSAQAGLEFNAGDILEIICKDDYYWWQARKEGSKGPASLIPSSELVEWKTTCNAIGSESEKKDETNCTIFRRKKSKDKQFNRNAMFSQCDVVSYEEVIRISSFKRKTLVLLGAHGVGRRHIKNTLISNHPNIYSYPIPHTTRSPRRGEENGKHYYFVDHDEMVSQIGKSEYLEYGTHINSLYGTKMDTIRDILRSEKIAILDIEPQALKFLRTAEFCPFVVFIAAPVLIFVHENDESLQRLTRESEFLQKAYGHLFDLVIINNDIEETVKSVEQAFKHANSNPQWIPVNWIY